MDIEENVLPPEINLVCFSKPELILDNSINDNTSNKKESGDGGMPKRRECADVLNSILPPRKWEENGKYYQQVISNKPSSKSEVKKLSEKLDTYLMKYNAMEVGICPIKRELYNQCFNEVIRQTTLNCVDRGYMLIKIRNEINATIDGYQKLYESLSFKKIRAELRRKHTIEDMRKKADRLKSENETLKKELTKTIAMTEEVEEEMIEARKSENERHALQIANVIKANEQIKDQILSLIAPKKSNRS